MLLIINNLRECIRDISLLTYISEQKFTGRDFLLSYFTFYGDNGLQNSPNHVTFVSLACDEVFFIKEKDESHNSDPNTISTSFTAAALCVLFHSGI